MLILLGGIIDLAKELARDRSALEKLHMHFSTAAYKTTFDITKTMDRQLTEKLKRFHFSLNLNQQVMTKKSLTENFNVCAVQAHVIYFSQAFVVNQSGKS